MISECESSAKIFERKRMKETNDVWFLNFIFIKIYAYFNDTSQRTIKLLSHESNKSFNQNNSRSHLMKRRA
jgi:hypothetical protein